MPLVCEVVRSDDLLQCLMWQQDNDALVGQGEENDKRLQRVEFHTARGGGSRDPAHIAAATRQRTLGIQPGAGGTERRDGRRRNELGSHGWAHLIISGIRTDYRALPQSMRRRRLRPAPPLADSPPRNDLPGLDRSNPAGRRRPSQSVIEVINGGASEANRNAYGQGLLSVYCTIAGMVPNPGPPQTSRPIREGGGFAPHHSDGGHGGGHPGGPTA